MNEDFTFWELRVYSAIQQLKTGLNEQRENCQNIQTECNNIINSIKGVQEAREEKRREMEKRIKELKN